MLVEYYFKIQYTKGTDNVRVDALSRKAELQNNEKLLGALLKLDQDRLIRYNYLKLAAIRECRLVRSYNIPKSIQLQRIAEVQLEDLDLEEYINREVIYILGEIIKEFIKEFYKGII